MNHRYAIVLLVLISMLFSACGGGGGGTASVDQLPVDQLPVDQQPVDQPPVDPQIISLSWTAPSTRTDGSSLSLSELVGYRIYSGSSPSELTLLEEIIGVSETSAALENLDPGVYYFAVTAYDSDGLESGFSQVVTKEVI